MHDKHEDAPTDDDEQGVDMMLKFVEHSAAMFGMVGQALKLVAELTGESKRPMIDRTDAEMVQYIDRMTRLVTLLLPPSARAAVVISDDGKRAQLGSNYSSPTVCAKVLRDVANACDDLAARKRYEEN